MGKRKRVLSIVAFILSIVLAGVSLGTPARADTLSTTENQITTSANFDTTPTLGADIFGDMVVYSSLGIGPLGFENGVIFVQPLGPSGAPLAQLFK